jgi:hypothetical protein
VRIAWISSTSGRIASSAAFASCRVKNFLGMRTDYSALSLDRDLRELIGSALRRARGSRRNHHLYDWMDSIAANTLLSPCAVIWHLEGAPAAVRFDTIVTVIPAESAYILSSVRRSPI